MPFLRASSASQALSLSVAASAVVVLHFGFAGSVADAMVLLVGVVVAFAVVPKLSREPPQSIERLTCTARAVTVTQDFSVRVPVSREDQYGHAVDAFNQMLASIERSASALRAAKLEAEAAAKSKGAFLAAMSHEIRTPMNAVMGMAQLLEDTGLTEGQQDMVRTIRSSAQALVTIVNDILDFSKMEAGRLTLESRPYDLRQCVEECMDLFASRAAEKGLDLAYKLDEEVPTKLVGDVTRLRQVLINLLGNALKFTDDGEVVVSVGSKPVGPRRSELRFTVRDTGIGISKGAQERIFRAYQQADSSVTREFGGTGLGLSICKHLTRMMGGAIWVDSEPRRGSAFHFTIVCRTVGDGRAGVPGAEILRGKRVLVVEDNPTVLELITGLAHAWGMEAKGTTSGREALDWVAWGEPFDLGIIDRQMPGMDGLKLAREIRNHRDKASLPLMLLTTVVERPGPGGAQDTIHPSFSAFLAKPIKPSRLRDVLSGLFSPRQSHVPGCNPSQQLSGTLAERVPLRILVADDAYTNRKLTVRILERMGYAADAVTNGHELLEAHRANPYDVIITDVHMPNLDGLSAVRKVREEETLECSPYIVGITGSGSAESCLMAGMDDHLLKPYELSELEQVMERAAAAVAGQRAVLQTVSAA